MFQRDKIRIAAVVTTYFPDESLRATLAAVLPQVDSVILVDDSGEPTANEMVRQVIGDMPEVILVCNGENLGLAKTLNRGIQYAIWLGAEFVLTLDDDSVLGPDYVRAALRGLDESSRTMARTVGALRLATWRPANAAGPPASWRHKRGLITSGMIVPSSALCAVGGYREPLVIDGLDYDLCIRLRKAGFCVLEYLGESPSHRLGNESAHSWLGGTLTTTNHSPLRRYYQTRNWITLGVEELLSDPLYCAASLWFVAKTAFKVAAFERGRLTKLRAMAFGASDAFRGRLGPCPVDSLRDLTGINVRRAD